MKVKVSVPGQPMVTGISVTQHVVDVKLTLDELRAEVERLERIEQLRKDIAVLESIDDFSAVGGNGGLEIRQRYTNLLLPEMKRTMIELLTALLSAAEAA